MLLQPVAQDGGCLRAATAIGADIESAERVALRGQHTL